MIARAFLKPIGRILFEQRGKSSSINSTRYAELYPQNVEHVAIVDSAMTSFHPMYFYTFARKKTDTKIRITSQFLY